MSSPVPTVADVERITAVADPVLRNLQITQCYHELAAAMAGAVEALWDALSPAAALERTTEAVARGNRKVFEEIGYQFTRPHALHRRSVPGLSPGSPLVRSAV